MEISDKEYSYFKSLESDAALMGAQLEWVEMALKGEELDDFAMSFPNIRRICDLVAGEKIFLGVERSEDEDSNDR